jgi:peptide/nickel transport system permease protein
MTAYIIRRLILAVPVLFGITVIAFVVLALAPGDPAAALIAPERRSSMSPADLAAFRHALGLDGPIHVRYFRWLEGILRGDFGYSIKTGRAIADEIGPRIGPTLLLMSASIVFAALVGIPAGVISAIRQYGRVDYALTGITMVTISTPTFVTGLVLIYIFGVNLRVLPTGGMQTIGNPFSVGDLIAHMALPVLILGFANAAPLMRYTRAGMLEVLNSEYVQTARAKGLRSRAVMIRHALRSAMLPLVTFLGLLIPELVAGAIITEQVFSWPGMGSLAVQAANSRDPSLMMGIVLIVAIAVLLTNILIDVSYTYIDPRVRVAGQR